MSQNQMPPIQNHPRIFIVGAKRTPIGSFLGQLAHCTPAQLGTTAVKAAISASTLPQEMVDEVIIGHVLSAGAGQGVARQIALHAGCRENSIASSVNMVCGSGLKAVMNGWLSLQMGMNDAVVAGGVEAMSQAPFLLPAMRSGNKLGHTTACDSIINDGLTDAFEQIHMGITAEKVAAKYHISRQMQDTFALASQKKAIQAQDAGYFNDEIVPIEAKIGRNIEYVMADEYINRQTSQEKLAALRPVFQKDGTVTAGNASGINDGASATVLVHEQMLEQLAIPPLVEIVAMSQVGVAPQLMGMGPVPAILSILEKTGLTLSDIGTFELNEAFAAQSVAVIQQLAQKADMEEADLLKRVNPYGGAIALGHPLGASGNRILVTLIHRMKREHLKYGIASLCVGGGMGIAILVRNCENI
ncbi:thiolase family protein [Allofustis seminis]|uniref:thiolase family protein n=1 Tax=Allofustis seminis TaxID=166939 RepID=UPI00035DF888|nr:thiolase family protein [Allofustis seminis]